jgi:deferrochelatase/peroxidase EfeB
LFIDEISGSYVGLQVHEHVFSEWAKTNLTEMDTYCYLTQQVVQVPCQNKWT